MTCCNLRGKGWGKRNVNINYIYDDELWGFERLVYYHTLVLNRMDALGWNFKRSWLDDRYRGTSLGMDSSFDFETWKTSFKGDKRHFIAHNQEFLVRDIQTLNQRGYTLLEEDPRWEMKQRI